MGSLSDHRAMRFALCLAPEPYNLYLMPSTTLKWLELRAYIEYRSSSNQYQIHIHHIRAGRSGDHQILQGLKEMIRVVAPEVV